MEWHTLAPDWVSKFSKYPFVDDPDLILERESKGLEYILDELGGEHYDEEVIESRTLSPMVCDESPYIIFTEATATEWRDWEEGGTAKHHDKIYYKTIGDEVSDVYIYEGEAVDWQAPEYDPPYDTDKEYYGYGHSTQSFSAQEEPMYGDTGCEIPHSALCKPCQKPGHKRWCRVDGCPVCREISGCPCCGVEKCSVCGDRAVQVLKKGEIVLCDKHYQQQFGKYSAESFAAEKPRSCDECRDEGIICECKEYVIPAYWTEGMTFYITAPTIDKAIEKAWEVDFDMTEGDYVDGSFQIDDDLAYSIWADEFSAEPKKMPPIEKAGITGIASGVTMEGIEALLAAEYEDDDVKIVSQYSRYTPLSKDEWALRPRLKNPRMVFRTVIDVRGRLFLIEYTNGKYDSTGRQTEGKTSCSIMLANGVWNELHDDEFVGIETLRDDSSLWNELDSDEDAKALLLKDQQKHFKAWVNYLKKVYLYESPFQTGFKFFAEDEESPWSLSQSRNPPKGKYTLTWSPAPVEGLSMEWDGGTGQDFDDKWTDAFWDNASPEIREAGDERVFESTSSESSPCPLCGGDMNCWYDTRPFDTAGGQCFECGFQYFNVADFMGLREVNEYRKAMDPDEEEMPPLKKLPFFKKHSSKMDAIHINWLDDLCSTGRWYGRAEQKAVPKGRVRTMTGRKHTPKKLKKDMDITPEEAARRIKFESPKTPQGDEIFKLISVFLCPTCELDESECGCRECDGCGWQTPIEIGKRVCIACVGDFCENCFIDEWDLCDTCIYEEYPDFDAGAHLPLGIEAVKEYNKESKKVEITGIKTPFGDTESYRTIVKGEKRAENNSESDILGYFLEWGGYANLEEYLALFDGSLTAKEANTQAHQWWAGLLPRTQEKYRSDIFEASYELNSTMEYDGWDITYWWDIDTQLVYKTGHERELTDKESDLIDDYIRHTLAQEIDAMTETKRTSFETSEWAIVELQDWTTAPKVQYRVNWKMKGFRSRFRAKSGVRPTKMTFTP